ncbi:hypothetical protein [Bacillus mojavensis]
MKVVLTFMFFLSCVIIGLWLMLSPLFEKVGEKAMKLKNILKDDDKSDKSEEKAY